MRLRSAVEPGSWPAILNGHAATLMAIQQQLDASQWWPASDLRAQQVQQLQHLVAAAIRTVPFYAQRLAAIGLRPGTPLHNYATPLQRYELADEAECGAPCPCGRSLPVLNRIVGRSTDHLTVAPGEYRRPVLGYYQIAKIAIIEEFQYVQRSLTEIELRLVTARPLNAAEWAEIKDLVARNMGPQFTLSITYHRTLPRTKAGKLRPFISDLPQADAPLTTARHP